MTESSNRRVRVLVGLAVGVLAAIVGWFLFVDIPGTLAELLGVLLTIGAALAALRLGGRLAAGWYPEYNVAEVGVEGPITRDGGGTTPLPTGAIGATADEIVDQIEAADEDEAVQALVMRLNTPGGEVLPSDDIRAAAMEFDGPTLAYASDVCASGGYWIASGCDELWAREASLVGSIGVLGSRPNLAGLAEKLGISYEQLTAGEYKDAGTPLKEMEPDEREYLQGIIDDIYAHFVDRVAEGRDLDESAVRETEARVYLGDEAVDIGLVDRIGDKDDVVEQLEEDLGVPVTVREFEPERGLMAKLGTGANRVAYSFGAGVASRFEAENGLDFEFRA